MESESGRQPATQRRQSQGEITATLNPKPRLAPLDRANGRVIFVLGSPPSLAPRPRVLACVVREAVRVAGLPASGLVARGLSGGGGHVCLFEF